MNLHANLDGDVLVVTPAEDRLDAAAAVQFKDAIRGLAGTAPPRMILNMAPVVFMDSSGLGAVIGSMKLLAPDTRLELAALTPAVEKVFKLTQMDRIFTIHADAPASPQEAPDACRAG